MEVLRPTDNCPHLPLSAAQAFYRDGGILGATLAKLSHFLDLLTSPVAQTM
jgi:hypothetical protein